MHVMDWVGPALGAGIFVAGMRFVPEPARRTVNAVFVAGAAGAYVSGGLGVWELAYPPLGAWLAWKGLASHRFIGLAWLAHAGWDLVHHFWANPIWPFMPTSSVGCTIFDSLIAVWFLAGAPGVAPAVTRPS